MQIPRFRFVLPDFGPAFWSNVHPISFASGEGGMEVIDGREGGLAQAKAEETQPYGQVGKASERNSRVNREIGLNKHNKNRAPKP